MIIYLVPLARDARGACAPRDATIPEDQRTGGPSSVLSCTTWGFSCLADYSASGELLPRLFNLACASLPKNRRCLFCDTFRQPPTCVGAARVFYAACCRMVFGLSSNESRQGGTHQRSSAIGTYSSTFRPRCTVSGRRCADFKEGKTRAILRQPEMQRP